jgi:hypothetical protein
MGGPNRKHRLQQSLHCCYGWLPNGSSDIVDLFTGRCQATHVTYSDRCIATVLQATVSCAKGGRRNLTPNRIIQYPIFSRGVIRTKAIVPIVTAMNIYIAFFWCVTQYFGTYVSTFRRNLISPSSGKTGSEGYLKL